MAKPATAKGCHTPDAIRPGAEEARDPDGRLHLEPEYPRSPDPPPQQAAANLLLFDNREIVRSKGGVEGKPRVVV